jgi:hypothetical protein
MEERAGEGPPLSSVLSPLLRRGERKEKRATNIAAACNDFDRY